MFVRRDDMEHKKAIIEALTLSVIRLGKEKMNEYEKGKIDGLKDAIRLILYADFSSS